MTSSHPGLGQTVRAILADAGAGGFYAGVQMNMLRVVPNCVSVFVTYEYVFRWMNASSVQQDDGAYDAI